MCESGCVPLRVGGPLQVSGRVQHLSCVIHSKVREVKDRTARGQRKT